MAALAFAQAQIRPRNQSEDAITAILNEWVKTEPEQAWRWARKNSPNDSVGLLGEIAKVNARMSWELAAGLVKEQPELTRAAYFSAVAGVVYTGDFKKAIELVDSLDSADFPISAETPNGKYTFLESAVAGWVRYSPKDVAAWISSLSDGHDSAKSSIANGALIPAWSVSDPLATLDYALTLPQNEARKTALGMAITHLTAQDVNQATAWLNRYGKGPEFDWIVYDLATKPDVFTNNIEAAIGWASSISDPGLRETGLVHIAKEWFLRDYEQAYKYFEGKGLLSVDALSRAEAYALTRIQDMKTPQKNKGTP